MTAGRSGGAAERDGKPHPAIEPLKITPQIIVNRNRIRFAIINPNPNFYYTTKPGELTQNSGRSG
jgi:hypothetical protein